MGLSEGKRKTRLVGSAVSTNSAWTNDASLPGQRLLSSMGWSQGQGLGTSSQGSAVPITMAFKMDNKGIGARRFEKEARANGVADAWVGGGGQLGDLFERLNKASNSSASQPVMKEEVIVSKEKSKSSKEDRKKREKQSRKGKEVMIQEIVVPVDEAEVVKAVEKVASTLPHRMAHRARFLRAKRMVGIDAASVNEILGIASPAGTSSPAPVELPALISVETDGNGSEDIRDNDVLEKGKKKRRREEDLEGKDKDERKEAKRIAKETRREERKQRKEKSAKEVVEIVAAPISSDPSSDPSFAAGGGMKVSNLSVHEYLQNQLMKRKAALVRRKREEDASIWTRAATVCI